MVYLLCTDFSWYVSHISAFWALKMRASTLWTRMVPIIAWRWLTWVKTCSYKQTCSTGWHKNTGTFEKPNKNWRNPRKKCIDRNWTITTCLLRDSNPNYQFLKSTSCRWRPPRIHSFAATTHFKSSRSFVSPCVYCMLCRMRQSRILQSMQHTQSDTKEQEL